MSTRTFGSSGAPLYSLTRMMIENSPRWSAQFQLLSFTPSLAPSSGESPANWKIYPAYCPGIGCRRTESGRPPYSCRPCSSTSGPRGPPSPSVTRVAHRWLRRDLRRRRSGRNQAGRRLVQLLSRSNPMSRQASGSRVSVASLFTLDRRRRFTPTESEGGSLPRRLQAAGHRPSGGRWSCSRRFDLAPPGPGVGGQAAPSVPAAPGATAYRAGPAVPPTPPYPPRPIRPFRSDPSDRPDAVGAGRASGLPFVSRPSS